MEASSNESRKEWILRAMYKTGHAKSNNKDFQFWQQHNHPIEMNTNEIIDSRIRYVHQNPVIAGFVNEPREWKYGSAKDYEDEKGLIDVVFLE